jgi:hypothetical protein
MRLIMPTGQEITVEGLLFENRYANAMTFEEEASQSDKTIIYDSGHIRIPTFWGSPPKYIKPYSLAKGTYVPAFVFLAWLKSKAIKSGDWSELALIWLGPDPKDKKMSDILFEGMEGLEWEVYAKDTSY